MNNLLNMMNILSSMKQNPLQVLSRYGMNIPNSMNNPQDIIQHLLNTGQISQQQVNAAQAMKDNPMFKNLK